MFYNPCYEEIPPDIQAVLMKVTGSLVSQSLSGELWLSCQELVALPHRIPSPSLGLLGAAGLMDGTFFWLSFWIHCECSQCLPDSALGSLDSTEQLTLQSCWIGRPSFPTPLLVTALEWQSWAVSIHLLAGGQQL